MGKFTDILEEFNKEQEEPKGKFSDLMVEFNTAYNPPEKPKLPPVEVFEDKPYTERVKQAYQAEGLGGAAAVAYEPLHQVLGGTQYTVNKAIKGLTFNAPEVAVDIVKKINPNFLKGRTLEEAMLSASQYDPGAFAKFVGGVTEAAGGFKTGGAIGQKLGLLKEVPKQAGKFTKLLKGFYESAKLGGITETAEQASKLAQEKISGEDRGFEGVIPAAKEIGKTALTTGVYGVAGQAIPKATIRIPALVAGTFGYEKAAGATNEDAAMAVANLIGFEVFNAVEGMVSKGHTPNAIKEIKRLNPNITNGQINGILDIARQNLELQRKKLPTIQDAYKETLKPVEKPVEQVPPISEAIKEVSPPLPPLAEKPTEQPVPTSKPIEPSKKTTPITPEEKNQLRGMGVSVKEILSGNPDELRAKLKPVAPAEAPPISEALKDTGLPPIEAPVQAKEPWEMTKGEYVKSKPLPGLPHKPEYHRAEIQLAIKQGKSVPPSVLSEYPDLQKATKGKGVNVDLYRAGPNDKSLIYATPDLDAAKYYGKPEKYTTRIEKPLDLRNLYDVTTFERLRSELQKKGISPDDIATLTQTKADSQKEFATNKLVATVSPDVWANVLKKYGYDSVVFRDISGKVHDSYAILNDKFPSSPAPTEQAPEGGGRAEQIAKDFDSVNHLGVERGRKMATDLMQAIENKDVEFFGQGRLDPTNKVSRKWFTELTGIELPNTVGGTKEAVRKFLGEEKYDSYYAEKLQEVEAKSAARKQAFKNEKQQEWLSKKVQYNDKVMTTQDYLDTLLGEGGIPTNEPKEGRPPYRVEQFENGKLKYSTPVLKREFDYLKSQTPSPAKAPAKTGKVIAKITAPPTEALKLQKQLDSIADVVSKPIKKEIQKAIDISHKTPELAKQAQELIDFYRESYELPPPTGKRLKGGRQAGGTELLSDLVVESWKAGGGKIRKITDIAVGTGKMIKRNFVRGVNHIGTVGEEGRKIKESIAGINGIDWRVSNKSGNDVYDLAQVYKGLNKEQRELVGQYVNNRIDKATAPEWVKARAERFVEIADRAMNEKAAMGGTREVDGQQIPLGGSGEAYPHVLNQEGRDAVKEAKDKGLGSPRIYKWAQRLVDEGKAASPEDAMSKIYKFIQRQSNLDNPYLQRSRADDILPKEWIEWDGIKTMPTLIRKNWLDVESAREWGLNREKLNAMLLKIGEKYGSETSDRIKQFIDANIMGKNVGSSALRKLVNIAKGFQFVSKVATNQMGVLQNQLDRYRVGAELGTTWENIKATAMYPPIVNSILPWSRKIEQDFMRKGIIQMDLASLEGYQAKNPLSQILTKEYKLSEIGNQVYEALVKKIAVERDLALLQRTAPDNPLSKAIDKISTIVGQSQSQVKSRMRELGNDELVDKLAKGQKLSPELLDAVLFKTVTDRAFPLTMATKRLWWDKYPMLQLPAQFKHWQVENLAYVWRDVVKDTIKTGNVSKMVRFITATAINGEIYNYLKDLLTGSEKSAINIYNRGDDKAQVIKALARDVAMGGAGLILSMTYGALEWTAGVTWKTAGDIKELGTDLAYHPELTLQALGRFAEKEIPVLKHAWAAGRFLPEIKEKGFMADYQRLRQKGFEWKQKRESPGVSGEVKEWAKDVWQGPMKFERGENALPLEFISRNILTGDVDTAAKYMKIVLDDNPETGKQSILNSMHNRSPVPIADQDLLAFYSTLTPEEQKTAKIAKYNWEMKYKQALAKAPYLKGLK